MTQTLRCPECGEENQMRSGEGDGTSPDTVSWASFIECCACGKAADVDPNSGNQLEGQYPVLGEESELWQINAAPSAEG